MAFAIDDDRDFGFATFVARAAVSGCVRVRVSEDLGRGYIATDLQGRSNGLRERGGGQYAAKEHEPDDQLHRKAPCIVTRAG